MKKITIILLLLVMVTGCGEKEEKVVEPKTSFNYTMLETYIVQTVGNNYQITALIENNSDHELVISGYTYELYNSEAKLLINETVKDRDDHIGSHQKKVISFSLELDYEDIHKIDLYAFNSKNEYFDISETTDNHYKNMTDYVNNYSVENGNVNVEINNGDSKKVKSLELIVYGNKVPLCVSYINNPDILKNDMTTLTFECDNLTEEVKEVKLNYH